MNTHRLINKDRLIGYGSKLIVGNTARKTCSNLIAILTRREKRVTLAREVRRKKQVPDEHYKVYTSMFKTGSSEVAQRSDLWFYLTN